jgi:ABC-type glutathione transport system ATPase component
MSQRLGIAAALLGDPPVLLFDEPVNGLNPEGIRWVRTLMRTLAGRGPTAFVSSHLLAEMANTADRLVVIGRADSSRRRPSANSSAAPAPTPSGSAAPARDTARGAQHRRDDALAYFAAVLFLAAIVWSTAATPDRVPPQPRLPRTH